MREKNTTPAMVSYAVVVFLCFNSWCFSSDIKYADIDFSKMQAKWFYISSLGGNLNLLSKLLNFAKKNNIYVAFIITICNEHIAYQLLILNQCLDIPQS